MAPFLLCILFFAVPGILSAQGGRIYGRGDLPYEAEYWGSILAGRAPSLASPLFEAELSGAGSSLDWRGEGLGFGLRLATPSFYYDTPVEAAELGEPPSPRLPELFRALGSFPDLAAFRLDFGLPNGLSARTNVEIGYRRDWFHGQGSSLSWETWDWLTGLLGDMEFPRKAWVSWAIPGLGFAAGRFPAGIGAGRFSNSVLNAQAPYYDQLRLHAGNERLKLVYLLGSSSARLSEAEAEVQWREDADPDRDGFSYWERDNDHDWSGSRTALKLFSYHLLEWRPVEALRIGIAESAVVGGTTPALNFILPSLVWHNVYASSYVNVTMALLASAVPVPGLLISGEFLVDDAVSLDDSGFPKPNAFAWQGSASYSLSPRPGALLSLGLEYGHADTWTGVRWQPYLSLYQRQMFPGGSRSIDLPLGPNYGPDSDQAGAWLRYRDAKGLNLELSLERIRKGPIYMGMIEFLDNRLSDGNGEEYIPVYYDFERYAAVGGLADILSRPDELRYIGMLKAGIPLTRNLSASISLSQGFYRNYGHVEGRKETLTALYLGIAWDLAPGTAGDGAMASSGARNGARP